MAEMQKVSWRTVAYAALGTTAIIAAAVGIVHSDGVRPTALKSNSATRWLVYQKKHLLVLADGLTGDVLAKIDTDPKSEATGEIAVQGAGGAFLVTPSLGTVRSVSTANLQLGTPQPVGTLTATTSRQDLGVGANGLTVVNTDTDQASIVTASDIRRINVTDSDNALVARDGSMWLFTSASATHVNVDGSAKTFQLRGALDDRTTVGSHGVTLDRKTQTVHWLDGGDVPIASVPNAADAVLQIKGDEAPCVWLGAGDTLACVGATGIDRIVPVDGLQLGTGDKLAVAGSVAAVIRGGNQIQRIDLADGRLIRTGNPSGVPADAKLVTTAINGMIWIDDETGSRAWVIQQFGSNVVLKDDTTAPTVNAQGQITNPGTGDEGSDPGNGASAPGSDIEADHLDDNGVDDPPTAIDDSVTARAGSTVTIPVTANDYDPDGNAIAVFSVGDKAQPGHGTADVLNGTSVTYVPTLGYSGTDEFDYTIVDELGNPAWATVHLQLFPADSPNRPPIATQDHVTTRLGRAVTIDVLANDIDPERDTLTIATFGNNGSAKITDASGPTSLPALKYQPPAKPGIYTFTYQAADPQGGTSEKTKVTVDVLADDAPNVPPTPKPDSLRLRVGRTTSFDVKANDIDDDGDELKITIATGAAAVDVAVRSERLVITVKPGSERLSVLHYTLSDGTGLPGHEVATTVLVVRIDDTAPNGPPVANPDNERVVIGNSVKIAVTANDADPEKDPITVLSASQPDGDAGTTAVEGNSVRFTPNLPNITEPTPVNFNYKISDGNGNTATGKVTVTVLVEPLPRAPFARDDFADTFTDKPVIIAVLANDTDPSGGTPSIVGPPVCTNGGGTATTTADQRVSFVPPAGLNGTFRCKYSVSNTQGLSEAWIIVTVTDPPPGNHEPELIQSELTKSVNVGETLTLNASDIARDIDPGDSLVFASASLVKNAAGNLSFVAKSPSVTYLAPVGSGNDTPTSANLDVTISDGHDGYIQGTVTIKIVDVPPAAPPNTIDLAQSTIMGQPPALIDVLTALKPANEGVVITLISATLDTASPTAALIETIGSGTVRITPSGAGVVVATYVVQNPDKVSKSGKITLTVGEAPPVNPPPVANEDNLTVSSGGTGTVELLLNDTGFADPNDKPVVTLKNRPPLSFGTLQLQNGTLRLTATPDTVQKSATIQYILSDGNNPDVEGNVNLTIQACSESPPAVTSATEFTPYQTPFDIDLNRYVVSGHIVVGSISGAGLTGPTGTYTPPADMNDSVTVTYQVANGCNQTVPGLLTIDVNRAPVANSVSRELTQGQSLTLLATDLASDQEKLTIASLSGNPAWVTLVAGSDGPTLSAAPPGATPSGTYSFTANIVDPGGLTAAATVNLTITNQPPTAVADAYTTEASSIIFDPTVNDFDTEPGPLTVVVLTPPDQIINKNGNAYTVSLGHGVSRFDYTIADSGGLTSSSTITITSNRPPTVDPAEGFTDQPSLDLELSPIDDDGDSLTSSCNATPQYFDVQIQPNPEPGVPEGVNLHIMALNGFKGSAVFFCTFTDPFGAAAVAQVTVTFTDSGGV